MKSLKYLTPNARFRGFVYGCIHFALAFVSLAAITWLVDIGEVSVLTVFNGVMYSLLTALLFRQWHRTWIMYGWLPEEDF